MLSAYATMWQAETIMDAHSDGSGESDADDFDEESSSFKPLKALYATDIEPPYKNVKVYDNVQQYEGFIKAAQEGTLRKRLQEKAASVRRREGGPEADTSETPAADGATVAGPSTAGMQQQELIMPGRLFTKSQAPVTVQRRRLRTVLTRMAADSRGPCGRLKWCMDQRVKVKVYIRNYGRVRGVCSGYIVAFDKHWNLCLQDVDEIYQKKVRRKHVFLGDASSVPDRPDQPAAAAASTSTPRHRSSSRGRTRQRAPADHASRPQQQQDPEVERLTGRLGLLALPQSRRSQRRPTVETHRRHCNQLFVRGDNVVLVAVPDQVPAATATSAAAAPAATTA